MVYLDNAANAPVFPEVLEAMLPWLRPDHVGNPGSLHTQGVKAREAVENARRQVAKMIGADPSEVFFTSGGTESNNAWLQNFGGDLILTTALEHDSVLEPMSAHCHRHYIKVHKDGSIDLMTWNVFYRMPILLSLTIYLVMDVRRLFLSCG